MEHIPSPETLELVAARADRVAGLRTQLADEVHQLRAAIIAADLDGHGRNEIARRATGGLSRKLVFEALKATYILTVVEESSSPLRGGRNRTPES